MLEVENIAQWACSLCFLSLSSSNTSQIHAFCASFMVSLNPLSLLILQSCFYFESVTFSSSSFTLSLIKIKCLYLDSFFCLYNRTVQRHYFLFTADRQLNLYSDTAQCEMGKWKLGEVFLLQLKMNHNLDPILDIHTPNR